MIFVYIPQHVAQSAMGALRRCPRTNSGIYIHLFLLFPYPIPDWCHPQQPTGYNTALVGPPFPLSPNPAKDITKGNKTNEKNKGKYILRTDRASPALPLPPGPRLPRATKLSPLAPPTSLPPGGCQDYHPSDLGLSQSGQDRRGHSVVAEEQSDSRRS